VFSILSFSDGCKKCGIVVDNVVSSLDIVNCKSIQAQIVGKAPIAMIDKTDGLLLYLSRECLDIEILTAKSSEMNISVPGKSEKDDFTELAIPEQFKTTVKGASIVTTAVEHKG
jgi:adenylyl cyclase-associated protein